MRPGIGTGGFGLHHRCDGFAGKALLRVRNYEGQGAVDQSGQRILEQFKPKVMKPSRLGMALSAAMAPVTLPTEISNPQKSG